MFRRSCKYVALQGRRSLCTQTKDPVGFIGLGIMGTGMVKNLLKDGIPVHVWNRSHEKCTALKEEFNNLVTVVDTPANVARGCRTVVSMLSTPDAMREVYGKAGDGLLAGLSPKNHVVECGTYEGKDMVWASDEVHRIGAKFLAAPVSGSKVPAELGQLVFIASGDEEVAAGATDVLKLMGKSTHFLGPDPAGAANMKLVVNSMMANMLACLSEGMHLTKHVGLSPTALLAIVSEGAIATPMFAMKGPNMSKEDASITSIHTSARNHELNVTVDHDAAKLAQLYAPHFPLKHAFKDLLFAVTMAREHNSTARMSFAACDLFKNAFDHQLGDFDFSAVHASIGLDRGGKRP
jgi:3-hydroxyisobutyrate dehydrogenase-like beta-hydroxyacid dehydrogenase